MHKIHTPGLVSARRYHQRLPKALWYHEYGYETALTTLALYPEQYRKLIQVSAVRGRQRAVLRAVPPRARE